MSSQCLCTACAETPEEGVIITLHNYWCCVANQMKHSQDHSHRCALGTSFQKAVDMNCIPSTNSAHHSRKLSTNMLTLHSSAYATPVVVQCNHDPPPPPGRSLHKPHTDIAPKLFIPKAVWLHETSHHVTWSDSHTETWCGQSVSQLTPVSGVTDTHNL